MVSEHRSTSMVVAPILRAGSLMIRRRYGRHLAFTADITTDQMTVEAVAQLQEGLRALLQTEMGADFTAAISPGSSTVQIEQNKNGGVTNV